MIKYKCDGCGKEFEVFPSVLKKRKHLFCSKECYKKNINKRSAKIRIQLQPGAKKICKNCGRLLDISYFEKAPRLKDGYENKCKECRQEQRRKYIRTCLTCGKQFKTANKEANYCSNTCIAETKKKRIKIKCFVCGKIIEMKPSQANGQTYHFCSKECSGKWRSWFYSGENNANYKPKIKCICDVCGKEFYRQQSEYTKYKNHYCSKECQAEHYTKRFAKENNPRWNPIRLKIKCAYCGKEIATIPSKLKTNKRLYCSVECKDKGWSKYYSGKNSPQWNPNKTNEERIINRQFPEYYRWRIKVFERDKYTCQRCGDNRGGNLRAHHILNYSEHKELRLELNNSVTLCKKCHKKFHDTYGYTHNNKEQLKEFLENYKQLENIKEHRI